MKKFIRLNITAEGQTEERFIKNTLAKHLGEFNISTNVRRVKTSKNKRGGITNYEKAKNDILTWLKEEKGNEVRFTTMFDLYALPTSFPGFKEAQKIKNPYEKVIFLEKSFSRDINDSRFIPYIQLHKFESLILANPQNLEIEYFEHEKAIEELKKILKSHKNNSELINDGNETAPSKRLKKTHSRI